MDIRYSRTVKRIQSILENGLHEICDTYLRFTRTKKAYEELPNFRITLTSVNTSEDYSRMELLQIKQETLAKQLDNLERLSVDLSNDGYATSRRLILNQFFGSFITNAILEDERVMPVLAPEEGGESNNSRGGNSPMSSFNKGGGVVPGEGNETPSGGPELSNETEPSSNDITPPEDVKYELQ